MPRHRLHPVPIAAALSRPQSAARPRRAGAPGGIDLQITQLDGAAVGPIYLGDGIWSTKVDWADYTPQEFEDRMGQFLAQYLKEQHELAVQGLPTDPEFFDKLNRLNQKWYELSIQPMLERAAIDCAYAKDAVPKALAFARSAQLSGSSADDPWSAPVMSGVTRAIEHCWSEQKATCWTPGDQSRLQNLIGLARQIVLLGGTASIDDVPVCAKGWWGDFNATYPGTGIGSVETVSAHVVMEFERSTVTTTSTASCRARSTADLRARGRCARSMVPRGWLRRPAMGCST
jgi:hypothetical protein